MPNGQRPSISNNSLENRGLAWNKGGCWLVQHTSGQPEYDITQLLPFLIPDREKSALDTLPDHLKDYPLTPEECYNIGPGNTVRVVNPGHPSHGIVGIVGEIAMGSSTKKLEVHFKQPLPPMTGGGRLVAVPLEKVQLIPDLPKDKWAIQITPENIDILDLFMKGRRHEWKEYRDGWALHVGSYFHYPPYCVHAHSSTKRETSYNLVTLKEIEHIILVDRDPVKEKEQVIINNLNLKEDGKRDSENREVIKVQRPNLSIRRDSTIREIGFRCPKSQIRIGTLDSEDQARFSAS
jgi:hypothetical protein